MSLFDRVKKLITAGLGTAAMVGCTKAPPPADLTTISILKPSDPHSGTSVYDVQWDRIVLMYDRAPKEVSVGLWRASFYYKGHVLEYNLGDSELDTLDPQRLKQATKDFKAYAVPPMLML